MKKIKNTTKLLKQHHHREKLKKLQSNLNEEEKRLKELNQEQGASS